MIMDNRFTILFYSLNPEKAYGADSTGSGHCNSCAETTYVKRITTAMPHEKHSTNKIKISQTVLKQLCLPHD